MEALKDVVPLYPPYLNKGSAGPAVRHLQVLLNYWALRLALPKEVFGVQTFPLVVNGRYDDRTADAVRLLQIALGFEGEDVDGNFGPGTRHRVKERLHVDVKRVPGKPGQHTLWRGPQHEDGAPSSVWPALAA